jgi:hypothetical protein
LPPDDDLGELGQMTNLSQAGGAWMAGLVWLVSSVASAADTDAFAATARRAGLRVISSPRLVLATDRLPRAGDGVDELPAVFDQAFATWCTHYRIAPDTLPRWRACGCLMADRERFRAAGLLPADLPAFTNGFCLDDRLWLVDPSAPARGRACLHAHRAVAHRAAVVHGGHRRIFGHASARASGRRLAAVHFDAAARPRR